MLHFTVEVMLKAGLPVGVAAVLMVVAGGLKEAWRARLQALIVALGFCAGTFFLDSQWIEAMSWSAVLLGVFVCVHPAGVGARYGVRALFVLAVGVLILWPIHGSLSGNVDLRNLLAFFFLGLGTWSIAERAEHSVHALTLILLPLLSALGLVYFLLRRGGGGALTYNVGVYCALFETLLLVCAFAPKRISRTALVPFVSVFIVSFMVFAHFYLHVNPWAMIYLAAPYLVLWFNAWIPGVPEQPMGEALVLGAVAALPLGYFLWGI